MHLFFSISWVWVCEFLLERVFQILVFCRNTHTHAHTHNLWEGREGKDEGEMNEDTAFLLIISSVSFQPTRPPPQTKQSWGTTPDSTDSAESHSRVEKEPNFVM